MNIKLSRVILGSVTCTIIGISIMMGINNSYGYNVVNIKGDKSILEDISIISQTSLNLYNTQELKVTNDNIDVNNFAVNTPVRFSSNKDIITSNKLLEASRMENEIYKYDNYIGTVNADIYYTEEKAKDEKIELEARIVEENLDTNEVKTYNISLGAYFENDNEHWINSTVVPIKSEDGLYIVIGIDIHDNNENKYENGIKESRVYVYKLNLENENAQHILTKSLGTGGIVGFENTKAFSNNESAYFTNTLYSKNEKSEIEKTIQLLSFNIKTKEFNTLEIDKNIDGYIENYYIDNDKAYFISSTTNYQDMELSQIEVDLKENKLLSIDKKYILNTGIKYKDVTYELDNIRCIDNKLYISIEAYTYEDCVGEHDTMIRNFMYVVDKESGETLYAVKLNEGKNINASVSVIKEN